MVLPCVLLFLVRCRSIAACGLLTQVAPHRSLLRLAAYASPTPRPRESCPYFENEETAPGLRLDPVLLVESLASSFLQVGILAPAVRLDD